MVLGFELLASHLLNRHLSFSPALTEHFLKGTPDSVSPRLPCGSYRERSPDGASPSGAGGQSPITIWEAPALEGERLGQMVSERHLVGQGGDATGRDQCMQVTRLLT
jgi:hypothetical protein